MCQGDQTLPTCCDESVKGLARETTWIIDLLVQNFVGGSIVCFEEKDKFSAILVLRLVSSDNNNINNNKCLFKYYLFFPRT